MGDGLGRRPTAHLEADAAPGLRAPKSRKSSPSPPGAGTIMLANGIGSADGRVSPVRIGVLARRTLATTLVALAIMASGAYAYWQGSGEGSASAGVGTLSAPTISSATPGAESVELTWTAVTPPGSGTVEYFVTRDGGLPAGNCPSSSSHSTATTCIDT